MAANLPRELAVLLVGTTSDPAFMLEVLAVVEALYNSLTPEVAIETLGQLPLGGFFDAAMSQFSPGDLDDAQDSRTVFALAALIGAHLNGFVHGVLASTRPSLLVQ